MPVKNKALLTVGKPELLIDDSDVKIRNVIHRLHAHGQVMEQIAVGFGLAYGVSGVQHQLLTAVQRLQGDDGVSVIDIADYLRRSGSFITIESGKLIKAGLLEKSPDKEDKRRVRLRLTEEADRRLNALAPIQRQVNDLLFAFLDTEKFAQLAELLEQMLPCAEHAADMLRLINRDQSRSGGSAAGLPPSST